MKLLDTFLDWALAKTIRRNTGNRCIVILDKPTLIKYLKENPNTCVLSARGCYDEFQTPITMYELHSRLEQLEHHLWNEMIMKGIHPTPAGVRANTPLPMGLDMETEEQDEEEDSCDSE